VSTEHLTVVIDADGMPIAAIDTAAIDADGKQLAALLTYHSLDAERVHQLIAESLERHGPRGHGLVCAVALQHLVEEVLDPLVQIAEAHGIAVRQLLINEPGT
jgi:hypothetical protein